LCQCDAADPNFYPQFKPWCDRYFFINHRKEHRGIGGIFFDDLDDRDFNSLLEFSRSCAHAFMSAYVPIAKRHMNDPFTADHMRWQQLRRGRYVEFNLVEDRGTKFGLSLPNPRTEAILMSLPPTCSFAYRYIPLEGSAEAITQQVLQHARDNWVS
jgi:coproporphyrinogen III oxidase